jgi:formylglycine-generating enzyme required for sulfatase activity
MPKRFAPKATVPRHRWFPRLTLAISVCLALQLLAGGSAAQSKKPLAESEIESLLKKGVTPTRVAALLGEQGISFEPTSEISERLRAAGANDSVIAAVNAAGLEAMKRKLAERDRAAEQARKAQADEEKRAADERRKEEARKKKDEAKRAAPAEATSPPAERARAASTDMVSVPGGAFFMGCNESVDSECFDDEKPGRSVDVAAFRIDKTEVTVAQYRRCVDAGSCSADGLNGGGCNWGQPDRDQHPINCVDWSQAGQYCQWAGKRLPTEAEWEKAARGTDGRKYPWDNTGFSGAGRVANIQSGGTTPVGSFPDGKSPYGALDMIGNVWEWTASDYDAANKVVRGGSWNNAPRFARASYRGRLVARLRYPRDGFRCAQ